MIMVELSNFISCQMTIPARPFQFLMLISKECLILLTSCSTRDGMFISPSRGNPERCVQRKATIFPALLQSCGRRR